MSLLQTKAVSTLTNRARSTELEAKVRELEMKKGFLKAAADSLRHDNTLIFWKVIVGTKNSNNTGKEACDPC